MHGGYIYLMKKLSNVFILFLSLAAVGVLAAAWVEEGFSLVQEVPKPLKPGQQATVKVTIKPGNIKGFVKLQLELPKGFTAQAVETKGGVFSMLNGSISLVWMEFPSAPSFTISYNLQIPTTATGNETIEGRLAFLLKGEKRMLTLDPTLVEIVPPTEAIVDNTSGETENDTTPSTTQTQPTAAGQSTPEAAKPTEAPAPANGASAPQEASTQPTVPALTDNTNTAKKEAQEDNKKPVPDDASVLIKVHREVSPINQNELSIKLVIENLAGLKSFAKFEENIPMGFKAKAVQTQGAAFTYMKNQVRILWNQMPMEETFFATYKIIRDGSEEKALDLEADFYFLLEGEAEVIPVVDRQLKFGEAPPAAATPAVPLASEKKTGQPANSAGMGPSKTTATKPANAKTTSGTSKANAPKPTQASLAANSTVKKDAAPVAAAVASTAKPEESSAANPLQPTAPAAAQLQFRVQICALRSTGAADDVAKDLGLTETITQEMHEGWHKFTVGNFNSYSQAKSRRKELSALPTGPFVAAYNQGTRITVQEALMVAGQKWVK
jgi:cell division septation protein DedD